MHSYLGNILIFLIAAVITVPLFKKFKIGAILAYLFAGIVIGPHVLELIEDPKVILSFSELGVVLLLFIIGLELNPSRLWSLRKSVFGLGAAQVIITGLIFTGIAKLIGYSLAPSFLIGFGLALSSTAFGIQILEENRQLKTMHGQGSFAILLFQDIAVVPLIAMIPLLSGGPSDPMTFTSAGRSLGIIVLVVLVGRYLVTKWFRIVAESRVQEVFTATSLLIVIGTGLAMEYAGLSMGMGAFLAGIMMANSEYRHELEIDLQPFKGLLMGLFFIAVGMSLDLSAVIQRPHIVMAVVVGFMTLKIGIIYVLGRVFEFPKESARNMACTLPQGGEFAFVLFSAALGSGILDDQTNSIVNASVTLSMALTPLVFGINQKYLRTYKEISEKPIDEIQSDGAKVIVAGYGRFGQVVARFLRTQNIQVTILEHSAAQVDTARKFGAKIFYGNAARADIVESAGGKEASFFVLAIDDMKTSVETAKMVKKHFPNLHIIARARNRQHVIELMELGVTDIHRETFLTSLEVAKDVLLNMGSEREYINGRLAEFRKRDEAILKNQFELRDDEKKMVSYTTIANKELEEVLRGDTTLGPN